MAEAGHAFKVVARRCGNRSQMGSDPRRATLTSNGIVSAFGFLQWQGMWETGARMSTIDLDRISAAKKVSGSCQQGKFDRAELAC
jgi:hypothetical protein